MRGLLILFLISATYAVPNGNERIVGGSATTIETYPFMANMQRSYWGIVFTHACGGSLITEIVVLSAAQCFNNDPASRWRIRLGSTAIASGGTEHTVSRIILHPLYQPRLLTNDVAIVRLATAATLSDSIKLARIAGPNYPLPDNLRLYTTGWGYTQASGPTSEVLQHVDVNIINHSLCTGRYAHLKTQPGFRSWPDVTPDMLCSGVLDVGGKNPCKYDTGGPLIHQNDVIVGITSWAYGCADAIYPGVNTRVPSYTQWIFDTSISI